MHLLPFDKPGSFFKGNLHTHSTRSDGHLSPEAIYDLYRDAGYDFVAITDHFLAAYNWPVSDLRIYHQPDFIALSGAELHAGETELGHLWHLLAVGLPLDFAPTQTGESGPQIAQRALDAGAYVAVAHPAWYILTEADVRSLGPVHAIEIYNGTSKDHNDKADSWYMLDLMTARGHRYSACATDDAHFHPDRADSMLGWVYVRAETFTEEALLRALKAGHYYSSTGPQILDVQVAPGDKITVYCTPADRIFITGKGYTSVTCHGRGLIRAELDISGFDSPYGRVVVRDENGKRAWTNPFWLA